MIPSPPPVRGRYSYLIIIAFRVSFAYFCFRWYHILAIFVYFFLCVSGCEIRNSAPLMFFSSGNQSKSIADCMLCLGFSLSLSLSKFACMISKEFPHGKKLDQKRAAIVHFHSLPSIMGSQWPRTPPIPPLP